MLVQDSTLDWKPEPDFPRTFSKTLVTSAQTAHLSAHRLRVEPGGQVVCHAHQRETEMHFIISGQGQALIGDRWEEVKAGDVVLAPPDVPHGIRNHSDEPLFFLCVFAPPLV